MVFDLVQCLIQRALLYATSDIRQCYVLVKKALYRRGVKKVVLILHSQGGIEGGMILDWLLNEVPQDLLQYLEVYTFGCLANHFSNPCRSITPSAATTEFSAREGVAFEDIHGRAISHIEHYANAYDFASRWGVLNFTKAKPKDPLENRFMGKVFVNPRAGHQLNQHYLDSIFPLDPTGRFTRDPKEEDFMGMDVLINAADDWIERGNELISPSLSGLVDGLKGELNKEHWKVVLREEMLGATPTNNTGIHTGNSTYGGYMQAPKIGELSRLWQYRNGGRPVS